MGSERLALVLTIFWFLVGGKQIRCEEEQPVTDCNEEMKTTLSSLESRLDEAERRMERAIDLNSESEDNEDSNVLAGMRILRQEGVNDLDLRPDGYDKRQMPPRMNENEVNKIMVVMDIYSIPQLDEIKEEIMVELRLSHYWYDTRLNDIKKPLELSPEVIQDLWAPDSYIHHAKNAKTVQMIKKPASLRINPDKRVQYSLSTMVTLACPMSFKHYPMDQQTCRIELQSFGYSNKEVNYTWMRKPILKPGINLDNYNVRIRHYSFHYKIDGPLYPGLGIRIELKRHLTYHVIQTYFPSVIFVTVAWVSFVVPSDIVPGRMVLCVTTILTLTSMFNSVRGLTPQVSYMKALDVWVFVCILFVFSSLAEYGLILYLTSRSGWQKKVDAHIRGQTGNKVIKTVNPVKLMTVTLGNDKEKEVMEMTPAGFINESFQVETSRESRVISAPNPKPPPSTTMPNRKERIAYAIEWGVKIVYPSAFLIFNIAYWSHYLAGYRAEPEV